MLNFNGSIFTVVLNDVLPFCDLTLNSNNEIVRTHYSFEVKLLEMLQERLNFKVKLVNGIHSPGVWGKDLLWKETVKQVADRKADFALCDISMTLERLQVVDFSRVTYYNNIAFISQAPQLAKPDSIVTMPFESNVWLAVLVMACGVLMSLKFATNLSLYDIGTSLIAISLKQHVRTIHRKLPSLPCSLYALWIISFLILSSAYCSVFYSIITVPHYDKPIDTVQDIVKVAQTDSHHIYVRSNSVFYKRFLSATPEQWTFYTIGQHIKRTKLTADASKTNEIKLVESDQRNILVSSRLLLTVQRIYYATKQLHIGSENIGPDYCAIMLQKNSSLTRPFNIIIIRFQEFGLIQKWTELSLSHFAELKKRKNPTWHLATNINVFRRKHEQQILAFSDLKSIFNLLLVGLAISILAFASEWLWSSVQLVSIWKSFTSKIIKTSMI